MYDEGACLATPALELIERANRDAAEARLATAGRPRRWRAPSGPGRIRGWATRIARRVGRRENRT
jgi:hypothetical protein